jgi:hypothetical protein
VQVYASSDNPSLWSLNTYYTIAEASSSIKGVFDNVTTNLAFLTPTLNYTNKSVKLILRRNNTAFDAFEGLGVNQMSTAAAVESMGFYKSNSTIIANALGYSVQDAQKLFDS